MDGIFLRQKSKFLPILLMLCGLGFIVLYSFLRNADHSATGNLLTFRLFSAVCCIISLASLLLNYGASLRIEDNTLKARYNWFSKLDCTLDDIEFAFPQVNTLTLRLKNGKHHVIMGLANAWELSAAIRRHNFQPEILPPEDLHQQLAQTQAVRKKWQRWTIASAVLMLGNIFIAVLLTGGKDLPDFSRFDRFIFGAMGMIELATVAAMFYAAQRCGKLLFLMEQLKYRLRSAVIVSQTLPGDHNITVYTDEDCTGRIVVCGYPNYQQVYCCVQEFSGNFELETVHTSDIYDSIDQLPGDGFTDLLDITSCFETDTSR